MGYDILSDDEFVHAAHARQLRRESSLLRAARVEAEEARIEQERAARAVQHARAGVATANAAVELFADRCEIEPLRAAQQKLGVAEKDLNAAKAAFLEASLRRARAEIEVRFENILPGEFAD